MALQEAGALGAGAGDLDNAVGDRLLGRIADVSSLVSVLDMRRGHPRDIVPGRDLGIALGIDQLKSDLGRGVSIRLVERLGLRVTSALEKAIQLERLLERAHHLDRLRREAENAFRAEVEAAMMQHEDAIDRDQQADETERADYLVGTVAG